MFRQEQGHKKKQRPESVPLLYVFCKLISNQVPTLRIFALSRLLVRAALFLWIRPLFTMVSIFGTAAL